MSAEYPERSPAFLVSPPSAETYDLMQSALLRVESLTHMAERTRGVGFTYQDRPGVEPDSSLSVWVTQKGSGSQANRPLTTVSDMQFTVRSDLGGSVFRAFADDDPDYRNKIDETLGELCMALPRAEAAWLRAAWHATTQACWLEDFDATTGRILDTSPFPMSESTEGAVDELCEDGSSLKASWIFGNEAFWADIQRPDATQQTVTLTTPTGRCYQYARRHNGTESLGIAMPEPQAAVGDRTKFLSLSGLRAAHRASQAAQTRGVNDLTEGKVVDFNTALSLALASK